MESVKDTDNKDFKSELLKKIKKEKFENSKAKFSIFSFLKRNKQFSIAFTLLLVFAIGGIGFALTKSSQKVENAINRDKINDWAYQAAGNNSFNLSNSIQKSTNLSNLIGGTENKVMSPTADSNMGYSVGGAKDINNFRENIKNGYLPLPTDITHEGIYYNYYFDTGNKNQCDKLFCASYTTALTNDKFSGKYTKYMTVGLNSGMKESDFKRPPLNLMIVLDISGSMSSPFNQYYYDRYGNMKNVEEYSSRSKLEVAKNVIAEITKKLNSEDSFGVVLFDDQSYIAKPIRKVGDTDMDAIREGISKLQPLGGTNMEKGLGEGRNQLGKYLRENNISSDYENRVIFLTDAMPNQGNISDERLQKIVEEMASEKIYSTFVGIGVDFNSKLVEKISDVKGANYFSVNSEKEFTKTIQEDFDLIVTPLVFDLTLRFDSTTLDLVDVYGVPGYKVSADGNGDLIHIKTLFPSRSEDGQIKGGVILLKLVDNMLKIAIRGEFSVSYANRSGEVTRDSLAFNPKDFEFGEQGVNYLIRPYGYQNSGIRKAILLSDYVNLMQNWLVESNIYESDRTKVNCPRAPFDTEFGYMRPCYIDQITWERTSKRLYVTPEYRQRFKEFKAYFEQEMKAIGDDSLKQEIEILNQLISS